MECPVRGRCCFFSVMIEGYNVILDNQPCEFLDLETGLCSDYENRKKNFEYCMNISEIKGRGGLPKGCLYLKEDPTLELHPKENIKDLMNEGKISQQGLMMYNLFNNINDIKSIYGTPIDEVKE